MNDEKPMGQVIQIDEARIRDHLGEMVRGTRGRDAERHAGMPRRTNSAELVADQRSQARQQTRAGSYAADAARPALPRKS